ncbi:tetratricopeptide repeat protein [Gemmatimonas sp.]|uniref:tetratricopeptide repeat protein n=1 Tax=Gemmatimonas sp. TaxID=1962908 RepID=UPI003F71CDF0
MYPHWRRSRVSGWRGGVRVFPSKAETKSARGRCKARRCDDPRGHTAARRHPTALAHYCLANALQCAGRNEEAVAIAEKALQMSQRHSWALSILVSTYAAWGKPEQSRALYKELADCSTTGCVQPSMRCSAAADAVGLDEAIAIAQRAIDDRDPFFVMQARTWPGYDRLRTDPRFGDLVRQLQLPNYQPGR